MNERSRYIVGIDLGTTNTVAAYIDSQAEEHEPFHIPVLEVPQLVSQGEVAGRRKLPSLVYLPGPGEFPAGSIALPWDREPSYIVGEFARVRGSLVPGRLVCSAKSWLCYGGVDRTAEILPWGASEDVERISPVEASAMYIAHIREVWNQRFAGDDDSLCLERQQVIITVPASFDESARELTLQAAQQAGIGAVTLVEEPQAAFYSWLLRNREKWEEELRGDQLILVCDVGGGTTDFSLIRVENRVKGIGFRRIAVGEHLLLGGDNMDAALADELEKTLAGKGRNLNARQWTSLKQSCSGAKELLLGPDPPERTNVVVVGTGTRFVGGTIRAQLTREQVFQSIVEKFFPMCDILERPQAGTGHDVLEFGLPYASDVAISRHLAAFLQDANATGMDVFRRPDIVLFNGGVFKAPALRKRIIELLCSWFPEFEGPTCLLTEAHDLDLGVARGAAYYGLVRRGQGIRIAGGSSRSFYVGLAQESAHEADPRLQNALCVAHQGLEEGEETEVEGHEFELLIREPVSFPFYSSRTRPEDKPGDMITINEASVLPLPPVQTVLRSGRKSRAEMVRVRLRAIMTETGMLELWCVDVRANRRWRLQLQARQEMDVDDVGVWSDSSIAEEDVVPEHLIERANQRIRDTFTIGGESAGSEQRPERLMRNLESILDRGRKSWPPGALRAMWEAVAETMDSRKTNAVLEARWLNLAGFLLRPGFGYPLDAWRIKHLWRIFDEGPGHGREPQVRAEWWILWRRVAGGLNKGQQHELFRRLVRNAMQSQRVDWAKSRKTDPEMVEALRTLASLERLSPKQKKAIGEAIMRNTRGHHPKGYELWAIGRLGARVPFYGPVDTVLSRETAEDWVRWLLGHADKANADLFLSMALVARRSGDRVRDIDDECRMEVLTALKGLGAAERLVRWVEDVSTLDHEDRGIVFGESLPPALRITR